MKILETLPRFNGGDYLFSTDFGAKPVNGFSKIKARIDGAADLGGKVDPKFVLHDLRRTLRTGLSALRVDHEIRELVIGHIKKNLVATYDLHDFADEKREAFEMWAGRLKSIVA